MRKLLKGFLVAAGVLLALAAVGVLAINLYVQSAGTQKRIEHALSSGLRVPVHVTSTMVTPWSGLKAGGITVPQLPPFTGNFLEAASFTAHFDWMGLFKHRLDAGDVSLDEPQVEWFQSPGGRWELPRALPAPQPPPEPGTAAGAVNARPGAPAWEISVRTLMVNGACFDFWDGKGMRVVEFAGAQFDCANPRASGTQGHARAKVISLHDRLFFRDMQTNWSFQRGLLKFSSFQAGVGGGVLRCDAQMATHAKFSPFNVDVNFDGVDVNQLMIEEGQTDGKITGALKGWLDLYGNPGKESSINGSGHVELAGGRMQHIDILETLGEALQIPDLVQMDLKTAKADVRVVSGDVAVDKLELDSQNLALTAHGTIRSSGKLALDARLSINGAITNRLPSLILNYFKPGDTAGARYIDFKVGNTLEHPKENLLENILGRRIQSQMTDLFKTLFGKKHTAPAASPP